MMQSANLSFRSSTVHYSFGGSGRNVLLCLHGYGETEHSFQFLEKYLPADYRLIAIDLPFHGKTNWKEKMAFTVQDLAAIVQAIFVEQGCSPQPFTLLGFSMGGRMALNLTEILPAQVKRMVLLAPDGLKMNFWYWLATQTRAGSRLFHFTMHHPGWFFWVMNMANRFDLVNPSALKFTRHYIHNKKMRLELYRRWMGFRKIRPGLSHLKTLIRQHRLPVRLLYGAYDRIILSVRGEKFRKGIEEFCTVTILKTGHQVLQEKNAEAIVALLQD